MLNRISIAGRVTLAAHNERLAAALHGMRLQPWPWNGPVALRENAEWHLVDGWAYLGSVASLEDAAPLLARGRQRFDRDTYLILRKWMGKVEAIPISPAARPTTSA